MLLLVVRLWLLLALSISFHLICVSSPQVLSESLAAAEDFAALLNWLLMLSRSCGLEIHRCFAFVSTV